LRYSRTITGSRTFLGETPDQRRARRREVLIDAALTIAHEEGLPAVGVRSLRARTKLNQRYFYESFDSVDALLICVLDQIIGELLLAGVAALHDPSHQAALARARHGLDVALEALFDDPRKATFLAAITSGPEQLQNAYRRRVSQIADAIVADPEAAEQGFDRTTAIFVAAGLVHIMSAHLTGELDLDRDALIDTLARLAMGAAGHRA
jgi:AcrR family transcriptional regulator